MPQHNGPDKPERSPAMKQLAHVGPYCLKTDAPGRFVLVFKEVGLRNLSLCLWLELSFQIGPHFDRAKHHDDLAIDALFEDA